MLGTYGTATMMVNLYETLTFVPSSKKKCHSDSYLPSTSTIHLFLSVRSASLMELPSLTRQSNACPDCQHHHRHGSISLAEHEVGLTGARFGGYAHEQRFEDAHEPFIHSRDVDYSRESSDYQTSGFGSPRRSAETLATDTRTDLGDIADCLA
jgi:hypothetical protein